MRGAKLWLFVFWIGVGLSQSASRTGAPTKSLPARSCSHLSQPKTQLTHSNQIYQKERAQEGQTHFFSFFQNRRRKKLKNLKNLIERFLKEKNKKKRKTDPILKWVKISID